ncbi:hypothetical protein ZOSMA_3G00840 [Zostera marina]|uniref:C2H2-type domain-containing protein n=1 Tax=Zostera marina TaxID=29655 RepID=A0A0K9P3Q8_ZOSMR|nr:hypothetical protein ZOSMA_3G00840 [Zostera marina]
MDHEPRKISKSLLEPSIPAISNTNSVRFDIPFGSCSTEDFPDYGNHQSRESTPLTNTTNQDPRLMLNNLTFLEQKIHQVQDIVRSIIEREGRHTLQPDELAAQHQLVTADLTSIIIQLISTAGTLLPSLQNTLLSSTNQPSSAAACQPQTVSNNLQQTETFQMETSNINGIVEMVEPVLLPIGEDHDVKDCEDHGDCENLLPGSYEVLQLEKEEILASHTHFCLICGKGFKRDANLRMHMRGHGDEYKTPAALAKPGKDSSSEVVIIKRYSCPFVGCKRNKEHKKFQPLKTIPCVKNHYKRSHCDKSYTCSRCNSKKFSVIADLKTHEKHCGRDKWLCSCGTSFSRKDKLFGHVSLFQGHTPALPMAMDETKVSETSTQMPTSNEIMNDVCGGFCNIDDIDFLDIKGIDEEPSFYSSVDFDSFNFGGIPEYTDNNASQLSSSYQVSENSRPFMPNDYDNRTINDSNSHLLS